MRLPFLEKGSADLGSRILVAPSYYFLRVCGGRGAGAAGHRDVRLGPGALPGGPEEPAPRPAADLAGGAEMRPVEAHGIPSWARCSTDFSSQGHNLGVFGAPPILEPILVGIGMFTGGMGF